MRPKILTPWCLVVFLACGGAAVEEAAISPDETGDQTASAVSRRGDSPETTVVAQLNEMCAENWCDGDFDYEFLRLECGQSTCELFFVAERAGEEFEESVVFEYDSPILDDGELEAGYWERVTNALLDEWEPAQGAG